MNEERATNRYAGLSDILDIEVERCIEDSLDRELFFVKHSFIGEHWLNGQKLNLMRTNLYEE